MLFQVKVSSEQEIKVKVVNLQTCLKATVCKMTEKRKNVMEVVPYIFGLYSSFEKIEKC